MIYKTRHLEATKDFNHGHRYIQAGDKFEASELDAEYLVVGKKAKDAQQQAEVPTADSVDEPRRRGRQPRNAVVELEAPAMVTATAAPLASEAPGATDEG